MPSVGRLNCEFELSAGYSIMVWLARRQLLKKTSPAMPRLKGFWTVHFSQPNKFYETGTPAFRVFAVWLLTTEINFMFFKSFQSNVLRDLTPLFYKLCAIDVVGIIVFTCWTKLELVHQVGLFPIPPSHFVGLTLRFLWIVSQWYTTHET